ncbi:MAG: hypothetical protein VKO65_01750 [Cyanobacteriota bacterium]|nr:hypothetical protein [Cyanobacteriota bacterium]
MAETNWRELCRELTGTLAELPFGTCEELLVRAKAALAQSEPDGPAVPTGREPASVADELSDEELLATLNRAVADFPPRHPEAEALNAVEYPLALELRKARAIIAADRARRPAPAAEGEVGEGPPAVTINALLHPAYEPGDGSADGAQLVGLVWWHPVMGCDSLQMVVDNARNILRSRWGRPAPVPVPVSERPWERKGWCDGEGRCWCMSTLDAIPRRWWLVRPEPLSHGFVLPAHALPLPSSTHDTTAND